MKLLTLLATATTSLAASTQLYKNFCDEDLWLTLNNGKAPYSLPSGSAFTADIQGQGNTAILTKNDDVYNPETRKLILGTSTDLGVLYWSLSIQDGNPFDPDQRFNVTSGGQDAGGVTIPNICQNATSIDGQVHACQDSGAVVLTLFACPFNAAV